MMIGTCLPYRHVSNVLQCNALSNSNKGEIHKTFSSNSNWPYRVGGICSLFPVTDSNFQTRSTCGFPTKQRDLHLRAHQRLECLGSEHMSTPFPIASTFNENISEWDVSTVKNMNQMFKSAASFNQPIGDWNVSDVTNMRKIFYGASAFNQPIGGWDVSSVTPGFHRGFQGATSFNQDLSQWDISSSTDNSSMFQGAASLSNANMGKMHTSFSTNPHWPYDWRQFVVINDSNFQTAVNLWFSNRRSRSRTSTYGHISDWNVSGDDGYVLSLFMQRSSFERGHQRMGCIRRLIQ